MKVLAALLPALDELASPRSRARKFASDESQVEGDSVAEFDLVSGILAEQDFPSPDYSLCGVFSSFTSDEERSSSRFSFAIAENDPLRFASLSVSLRSLDIRVLGQRVTVTPRPRQRLRRRAKRRQSVQQQASLLSCDIGNTLPSQHLVVVPKRQDLVV